ncbi:MAG: hypothetical protein KatS3mg132_634 [Limisphaera sp.]|nr:MAG: hypothetical protein KatS3mg132_634 [Limisphaera sp.]
MKRLRTEAGVIVLALGLGVLAALALIRHGVWTPFGRLTDWTGYGAAVEWDELERLLRSGTDARTVRAALGRPYKVTISGGPEEVWEYWLRVGLDANDSDGPDVYIRVQLTNGTVADWGLSGGSIPVEPWLPRSGDGLRGE